MKDLKQLIELVEEFGYLGIEEYYRNVKRAKILVNECNDTIWLEYKDGEWIYL